MDSAQIGGKRDRGASAEAAGQRGDADKKARFDHEQSSASLSTMWGGAGSAAASPASSLGSSASAATFVPGQQWQGAGAGAAQQWGAQQSWGAQQQWGQTQGQGQQQWQQQAGAGAGAGATGAAANASSLYVEHDNSKNMSAAEVEAWRAEQQITVVTDKFARSAEQKCPNPIQDWEGAKLNFPGSVMAQITASGFAKPSPIQSQAWPVVIPSKNSYGSSMILYAFRGRVLKPLRA